MARTKRLSLTTKRLCIARGIIVAFFSLILLIFVSSKISKPRTLVSRNTHSNSSHSTSQLAATFHLANSSFCLSSSLSASWHQRQFVEHEPTGFIQYSAYRLSLNKIAIVGLQIRELDRHGGLRYRKSNVDRSTIVSKEEGSLESHCHWYDYTGSIVEGKMEFLYTSEHHNASVETVVIHCTLAASASDCGGHLLASIGETEAVLFSETPGESKEFEREEIRHELTFCSPTLHSDLFLEPVFDWLEFHRVHFGVSKFIFYDSGIWSPEMNTLMKRHLELGILEITDFSAEAKYKSWFHAQTLAMHDCLYRARKSSRWVFMMDFDEFLEAVPPNSLPSILKSHASKSWLSFGGIWWDVHLCTERSTSRNESDFERMVFRREGYFCGRTEHDSTCEESGHDWPGKVCKGLFGELCDVHFGRRKYFVNPRKVDLLLVHEVLFPMGSGIPLNARKQFRLNHYRWLTAKTRSEFFCNETIGARDNPENGWIRDFRVSRMVKLARSCAIGVTRANCGVLKR